MDANEFVEDSNRGERIGLVYRESNEEDKGKLIKLTLK